MGKYIKGPKKAPKPQQAAKSKAQSYLKMKPRFNPLGKHKN